eukprot:m.231698 g.231698  ORF g.231698 m.231698 type:complete len:139 (+) comp13899_c1_seq23:99-515(+)
MFTVNRLFSLSASCCSSSTSILTISSHHPRGFLLFPFLKTKKLPMSLTSEKAEVDNSSPLKRSKTKKEEEKWHLDLGNTKTIPPFHLAFPVGSVEEAKTFYGGILGLKEGRSDTDWGRMVNHLVISIFTIVTVSKLHY